MVEVVLLEETLRKKIAVNSAKKYDHGSMGKLGITQVFFPNVFFGPENVSSTTVAVEYHRPRKKTDTEQYAKRKKHQPPPPGYHQVTHLTYEAYLQKTSSTIRDALIQKTRLKIRPKMRYRKLKALKNCKLRKMTRLTWVTRLTRQTRNTILHEASLSVSKIKLVGGEKEWEGNIIVGGKPVCDDASEKYGKKVAQVVCRFILFWHKTIIHISLSQNTDFSKNRLTFLTRHVLW